MGTRPMNIEKMRKRVRDAPPRRVGATSLNQSFSGIESWTVDIETAVGSWHTREAQTGAELTYDGQGTLRDRDGAHNVGSTFRPHPSVQLFFPDRLFVWGGADANWSPGWSEPDDDDGLVVIGLRHRTDRSLLASLTYDVHLNLFTRFDSPSESIHLREIKITYD